MRLESGLPHDEKGMILFSTLAILSVLLMVGIGSRVMLQNDYRVLVNLRRAAETFYLSTAGLEWGKNEIFRATDFPPKPADQSQNFVAGSFSVTFLSSTVTNPLSAKIVIRSTGSIGSSMHTVQAQLTKRYDLADAAIGLRGNLSQVSLSGGTIFLSGQDHDLVTRNPVPETIPRAAVSVGDESLRALIDQAAVNLPQGSLDSGTGPAIRWGEYLPATAISQLAASLCGQAAAILSTIPATGALIYENQNWGTRAIPELRCIEGLPEPADAVTLADNVTGVGILIVRNADLIVTGSLRWEGLVIVTGTDVSFRVTGTSENDLFGAVLVNEIGSSPSKATLDVQGNLRVVFSRQALEQVAQLISAAILGNTYTYLPPLIKQDYWRTVTP